jgi:hypothetical protein
MLLNNLKLLYTDKQLLKSVIEGRRGSESNEKHNSTVNRIQRNFFDRYVDKIKDFLDNAGNLK